MIDKEITIEKCTGCMMCGDVCPQRAITFSKEDVFWHPQVDNDKCTHCGLCIKKCPALLSIESKDDTKQPLGYGAWHKDEDIRYKSTSGGFFSALASYVILNLNGVVIGAAYSEDFSVQHLVIDSIEELPRLRQSKYLQSDTSGIYKKTKEILSTGRVVLFTGTSCQVAALRSFIGKECDNLITVDLICLGMPSPYVFRKYLDWLERRYQSKVSNVWFKYKQYGWRAISNRIDFENGKKYICQGTQDPYMISFVVDFLNIRPNCDQCRYRTIPHVSDFTLGDFWGVEKVLSLDDDNKGISAVLANTEKGQQLIKQLSDQLNIRITTVEDISKGNFTMLRSAIPSPFREKFMSDIKSEDFITVMKRYSKHYPIRITEKIRYKLSLLLKSIKKQRK